MKPTLIFDYDGTIHETFAIYKKSFLKAQRWLNENGFLKGNEISDETIKSWLGLNAADMWKSFAPSLPEKIREEASLIIGKNMVLEIESGNARWYEGAAETLTKLKKRGYEMYVLSNCKKIYAEVNYRIFHMSEWFKDFLSAESFGWIPKTEIMLDFSRKKPGEYVIIGDRDKDIMCAKACGGKAIGCSYGYGSSKELAGADFIIGDISNLPNVIDEINI